MMTEVSSNRPDVTIANRIKAMFDANPQIKMQYIDATHETLGRVIVHVYNNERKATAIRKLLKPLYDEITTPLEVEVVDESGVYKDTIIDAFEGNPHFSEYMDIPTPLDPEQFFHVCVFNKEVIQFKNDNGGSLHGYEFRLMENLAREVMGQPMLYYTTEDGVPRE